MAGQAGRTSRSLRAAALALTVAPAALPVLAHPHVFIDTGLEVVFDAEGRLAAVQVVWVYDAFYTMMALDDYGMDPEFTGSVTDAERAELAAIYSNWDEGFHGDLHPKLDGAPLRLSGPRAVVADVQDERLVIAHRRVFEDLPEIGAGELVLAVYDPTYFTAYSIVGTPEVRGRADCVVEIWGPDWEAANETLMAALDEMYAAGADMWEIEADFPAVGAEFAEEARLRCGAPSDAEPDG